MEKLLGKLGKMIEAFGVVVFGRSGGWCYVGRLDAVDNGVGMYG